MTKFYAAGSDEIVSHLGKTTPAETFRATYEAIPADDPFYDGAAFLGPL